MSTAELTQTLKAQLTRLPGSASARRLREQELERFSARGFPQQREESWRYTNVAPLARRGFDFAPPVPEPAAIAAARALLAGAGIGEDAPRLVLVDGHYAAELSRPPAAPLDAAPLAARSERLESLTAAQRAGLAGHPLAALNGAFARDGVSLVVPAGTHVADPVHLVIVASGGAELAAQPRVLIDVERGAELTVVQHFLGAQVAASWTNTVTQIRQAPESRLTLYRLQEHGREHVHTELVYAELAANAHLTAGYVDLGGALVRTDTDVKLEAPGAHVELFGLFLAAGQHVDHHTRVDHLAERTHSEEAFRGIAGRHGRGVFNGKVVVHPGAQHIDARQASNNLLLDDHAEIDTKPELEIYADDVKCSHGATVGELDADALFYLRARGIDEAAARGLLTAAFAQVVLERIAPSGIRERVAARVAARLQKWGQTPESDPAIAQEREAP